MAANDSSFRDFVIDQLRGMALLNVVRMFGGYGIYCDDVFFGIISEGRLYFVTDEETARDYKSFGMAPFQPNEKQKLKSYYEVPLEVLEDRHEMLQWAERAVSAQRRRKAKTRRG